MSDFVTVEPATEYELSVLAFTAKREGALSDARRVVTDTAKPSPPVVTNVNCTGAGDILVEWRRSRVIHGKINYFIVYYKSRQDETFFKRKIDVSSSNSSDLYLVSQSLTSSCSPPDLVLSRPSSPT